MEKDLFTEIKNNKILWNEVINWCKTVIKWYFFDEYVEMQFLECALTNWLWNAFQVLKSIMDPTIKLFVKCYPFSHEK